MKFCIIAVIAALAATALQPVVANPISMPSANDTSILTLATSDSIVPTSNATDFSSTDMTSEALTARDKPHKLRIVIYTLKGRYHLDYVNKEYAGEDGYRIKNLIEYNCRGFHLRDWETMDTDNVGYHIKFSGRKKRNEKNCIIHSVCEALHLDEKSKADLEVQLHA